jgi:DNA-binding response OmpR family regulator
MDTAKKKIVIVEDDASVATMYARKFEREGYDVKIAGTGIDAIVEAVEFRPDAILLDIMMPSMDGFETLRALRNLAPSMRQVRIVVFSNLSGTEYRKKAEEAGADAYLVKAETSPSEAVAAIEKALSRPAAGTDGQPTECPHCGKLRFEDTPCCGK